MGRARVPIDTESGSALVFSVLVFSFILIMVALVIDGIRATNTHIEKQDGAGLMALSCLQKYMTDITTYDQALPEDEARVAYLGCVQRAGEIGQRNGVTAQDDAPHADRIADVINRTNWNQPGRVALIQLGRYYYRNPFGTPAQCVRRIGTTTEQARCLCSLSTEINVRGCFVPCDNYRGCPRVEGGVAPTPANSVRVRLFLPEDRKLEGVFSRALGIGPMQVVGEATAVAVPRRGVFILDASRSTANETHLQWQKTSNRPSESTFACQTRCRNVVRNGYEFGECESGLIDDDPPYQPSIPLAPTVHSPTVFSYSAAYYSLPDFRPHTGTIDRTQHFKSDYRCVEHDYIDARGVRTIESLLVDVRSVPEPYGTLLDAMHESINLFERYHHAGDLLGGLLLDEEVVTDRSSSVARFFAPGRVNRRRNPDLRLFSDLTDRENIELRVTRYFTQRFREHLNLTRGLEEAQRMLQRLALYDSSDNFVVLFSSGLSSCHSLTNDGSLRCSESFDDHHQSLEQVLWNTVEGSAVGTYEGDAITLHVVHAGKNVEPHRVLVSDPTSEEHPCLSGSQMANGNFLPALDDVDLTALRYQRIGGGTLNARYHHAGYYLGHAATMTKRGLFVPIIPPGPPGDRCDPNRIECRNPGSLNGLLNFACRTHWPRYADPTRHPLGAPPTSLSDATTTPAYVVTEPWLQTGASALQDSRGRVLCDPFCAPVRSTATRQGQLTRQLEPYFRSEPTIVLISSEQPT